MSTPKQRSTQADRPRQTLRRVVGGADTPRNHIGGRRLSKRLLAAAAALAGTVMIAACVPETFPPATDPPDASAVAQQSAGNWLATQFDATTKLIPSAYISGQGDPGGTAYAVTSLRLTGGHDQLASDAVAALAGLVDTFTKDSGGNDKPGSLARLILAVESVGANPRSFGGTDLVGRLEATIVAAGPDTGRFGVQDATYDGAFRQGLALAALSLVSPRPASIDPGPGSIDDLPAVAWLRSQQCANGSWMPFRADLNQPCAFNPGTYTGPDTNSTALAQLGLNSVGVSAAISPLAWLNSVKNLDGGWSSDGSPGSGTDPDSTGLVMAALKSLGVTPDVTTVNALLGFQFGASAPTTERGAFYYPYGAPTPNLTATNDGVLGLASGVWPASLDR